MKLRMTDKANEGNKKRRLLGGAIVALAFAGLAGCSALSSSEPVTAFLDDPPPKPENCAMVGQNKWVCNGKTYTSNDLRYLREEWQKAQEEANATFYAKANQPSRQAAETGASGRSSELASRKSAPSTQAESLASRR